ncbi:MAG TPA: GDSL-type esterase/lipase family protein [Rhodopila sp.]|nr:GDSL-type esterase/lipase family protein [Rhodopila sp.]
MPITRRQLARAALACVAPSLAFFAPSLASARVILAAASIARTDLSWWQQRHEAKLRELAQKRPNLIFLGDSITMNWERAGPAPWQDFAPEWQRFYGDRNAVNLGFKGDTTASLLWRIRNGEAAGIAPRAAVVLIGANNLGRVHWSAEDTVAGIDAVIAELRRRLPETAILLLSVLPSERSPWASETTVQINRALARQYPPPPYHDGQPVTFLDVTHLFMRDGKLDRDAFYDGRLTPAEPLLHPTAQAQAAMARAMEPVLSAMLHDRPHG